MSWTRLPALPVDKIHVGCANCSTANQIAYLDWVLTPDCQIRKDGLLYWSGESLDTTRRLRYFENQAAKDPDHDWRLVVFSALHGETYQRHGEGLWICVESNKGYA